MGIISGFLGGAGRGAAQAGQLLLADKLAKERSEADFLRDSALRKDLQADRQTFLSDAQATRLEGDNKRAAFTAEKANERQVATDASRSATAKADREARSADNKYTVDNKAAKNPFTVKVDNGQGQVVDYIQNADGSFSAPNIKGSGQITISTANSAKASADWETFKKTVDGGMWTNDKDVEKAAGKKKTEWLAQRGLEYETGVATPIGGDAPAAATPTPDVKPEVDAAPAATSQHRADPDAFFEQIMANEGADEAKAKAAVLELHPDWKGPQKESSLLEDISPVKDASASSGVVNSQVGDDGMMDDLEYEKPIIPESTPPSKDTAKFLEQAATAGQTPDGMSAQDRNQGIINVERGKRDLIEMKEDLVELEAKIKTTKERSGRTNQAWHDKAKRLKKEIAATEKMVNGG
jgi:hypothetical protein